MMKGKPQKVPAYILSPTLCHTVLLRHIDLLSMSRLCKRQNEEDLTSSNREERRSVNLSVSVCQALFLMFCRQCGCPPVVICLIVIISYISCLNVIKIFQITLFAWFFHAFSAFCFYFNHYFHFFLLTLHPKFEIYGRST